MNIELQKLLLCRYPNFLRKSADMRPFDERGIECEDGWFEMIDQLCSACEDEIEGLIARGLDKSTWPRVSQIKEKFGSLRFRVTGKVSAGLHHKFSGAEQASLLTCESCGKPGRLRRKNGIRTHCDSCRAQLDARVLARTSTTVESSFTAYLQQRQLVLTMLESRES